MLCIALAASCFHDNKTLLLIPTMTCSYMPCMYTSNVILMRSSVGGQQTPWTKHIRNWYSRLGSDLSILVTDATSVMYMWYTRQCGYQSSTQGSIFWNFFSRFGSGTGLIWLDDVNCRGSETRLTSCSNRGIGVHDCSHSEDVAIYCSSRLTTTSGRFIALKHAWTLAPWHYTHIVDL